ncbi:MAG: hypothetical protein J6R22_00485 [Alphaproteobacteria bacterium]|nr:hypothetical protein [Alphaproteobacteria bacterium]
MTHHDALWNTINKIATINNKTRSGLARLCKLDATAFNPSKRFSVHGQPRWISTETLYKILTHTNTTPVQFAELFQGFLDDKYKD